MNCPVCGQEYINEQPQNNNSNVRSCGFHSWLVQKEKPIVDRNYSVDGLFKPLQDSKEYLKRL